MMAKGYRFYSQSVPMILSCFVNVVRDFGCGYFMAPATARERSRGSWWGYGNAMNGLGVRQERLVIIQLFYLVNSTGRIPSALNFNFNPVTE